jgi:hypothetical protein
MCTNDWLSAARISEFIFWNDRAQAIICHLCSHELALFAAVHAVWFGVCWESQTESAPSDLLTVCMASLQPTSFEICTAIFFLSFIDRFSAHLSLGSDRDCIFFLTSQVPPPEFCLLQAHHIIWSRAVVAEYFILPTFSYCSTQDHYSNLSGLPFYCDDYLNWFRPWYFCLRKTSDSNYLDHHVALYLILSFYRLYFII